MKKALIGFIIMGFIITACTITFAKSFTDVPSSHWAYTYVNKLSDDGIINGYEDGSFRPSNTISKAEYIKLLVGCVATKSEMSNMITQMPFEENWYDPFVKYANRILSNKYNNTDFSTTVTRIEMASMLVDFADYAGIEIQNDSADHYTEIALDNIIDEEKVIVSKVNPDGFVYFELKKTNTPKIETYTPAKPEIPDYSDIHSLSKKDQDIIIYASQLGLIAGYEDGTFRPNNIMNRAEVATIIYRLIENM